MKRQVITYNAIQGFHRWPDAPSSVEYLSYVHRHIFIIRCKAGVSHNEREIEINTEQDRIEKALHEAFGSPCMFGSMSCESIAEWLLGQFPELNNVEVLEDGFGGASLTR